MTNSEKKTLRILIFCNLLAFGFLLFIALGCTPQRRLNRLIKKHPELLKSDTIFYNDTINVYIPGTTIDTVVRFNQLKDTIILNKENVTVKIFQKSDSIYILAKTDTVFKTVNIYKKIPYKKVQPIKSLNILNLFFFLINCFVLVVFFLQTFKKN